MSGLRHPVGPEPTGTYWIRRGILVVALVVVVVLLVDLVRMIAGPGSPTTAAPAGSSPGPISARTPSPSTTPGVSVRPAPTPTQTAAPTPVRPTECPAAELTTKIKSVGRAKPGKPVAFALGVVNRSNQTCVITLGPGNVELKVYSGTDRIWSSRDCRTLVRRQAQRSAAGHGLALMITWNGRRSAAGCKVRPEIPEPGTYYATFQLVGADPVQQRVIIS